MSKIFYVYAITNLVNGKLYIGKTNNPKRRWILHRNYAKSSSPSPRFNYPIYKALRKYGISNFTFDVMQCFSTEIEALEAEREWIAYLRSFGIPSYNITNGGEGTSGHNHSPETRKKISESNKGKQNRLGLTNSIEHNANISAALQGKTYSKERKIKWRQSRFGNEQPLGLLGIEKSRNIQSEQLKGELGPNAKLNERQVREIKQLIRDGLSTRKIAKLFGVGKSIIGDIGRGRCWSHITIDQ